jgi:hypothetical protein
MAIWSLLLSVIVTAGGIGMGFLVSLDGWDKTLLNDWLRIFGAIMAFIIILNTPVTFFASFGKGFLAPFGFLIFMVIPCPNSRRHRQSPILPVVDTCGILPRPEAYWETSSWIILFVHAPPGSPERYCGGDTPTKCKYIPRLTFSPSALILITTKLRRKKHED